MNSTIDYITAGLLLYAFYRGWSKGFVKIILPPISLILGWAAGYFYFFKYHNIIIALILALLGPLVIHLILKIFLKLWNSAINPDAKPNLLSRILGVLLSMLWCGTIVATILILIPAIPLEGKKFTRARDTVIHSKSYTLLNHLMTDHLPMTTKSIKNLTDILKNPEKLKQLESTEAFQNLLNDDRIKEIFSDPEIIKKLKEKNPAKILTDPKIREIFEDQDLSRKFFELYKEALSAVPMESKKIDEHIR